MGGKQREYSLDKDKKKMQDKYPASFFSNNPRVIEP
jgi:hypothetical protein